MFCQSHEFASCQQVFTNSAAQFIEDTHTTGQKPMAGQPGCRPHTRLAPHHCVCESRCLPPHPRPENLQGREGVTEGYLGNNQDTGENATLPGTFLECQALFPSVPPLPGICLFLSILEPSCRLSTLPPFQPPSDPGPPRGQWAGNSTQVADWAVGIFARLFFFF